MRNDSIINGKSIFEKYQKLRDYSGSREDNYAQDLYTINIQSKLSGFENEFFELLSKADEIGKKLTVVNGKKEEILLHDLILA